MAEGWLTGNKEKRTERESSPRMAQVNKFREARERSGICRPRSDRNVSSRVWPSSSCQSSSPVPCLIIYTPSNVVSTPLLPFSPSIPPRPSLFTLPLLPLSYAPRCHLGRPSQQGQRPAKVCRKIWYQRVPAGEREECRGHKSLSRRPWLRSCQPTQQHVPV